MVVFPVNTVFMFALANTLLAHYNRKERGDNTSVTEGGVVMTAAQDDQVQPGTGPSRQEPQRSGEQPSMVPSNERRGRKARVTIQISAELLDELRDVVVSLSGPPDRLTLTELAEGALRREVDRLKRVHRGGKNFTKRAQELRGGRPIK